MISIGNDIVALDCIDIQRTKQSNFYSKIITEHERSLFEQSGISQLLFEQYVWLLWSVKEAVYKYLKRNDSELVFSPAKIMLRNLKLPLIRDMGSITGVFEPDLASDIFYNGEVTYRNHILFFRSVVTDDLIATVADIDQYFSKIYWGIQHIDSSAYHEQSQQVRRLTLNKMLSLCPQNTLAISKAKVGYPIIIQNGRETDIPLSFAHHGYYVSYCFKL